MKKIFFFIAFIAIVSFYGCSTSGMFTSVNSTNVELKQPNYKIVATNISGSSESGYILGFTFPSGFFTNTFALARVSGTGMLYEEAIADLWKNFESNHGSVEGKKLALINVRYDTDALNLFFLYTSAKVNIRADVIEFE